ncbi:MAG: hypothetical protein KBT13_07840 [Bacteroidales bacterium]|nr:hypothetical protein [Candidatus Sodaliphilus limicaballi]
MRCILLVSVALVVACLVSCGSRADRPSLVAIDSLILQAPDSACELLADYPEDSLTTANDRAYHALLTTIARYKAYRPATSDSTINIALSHYDHNGANPDKRMRSLLYKGCVMEELGDAEAAMRSYKEAQYACPDDDNFHKGYIHFRIGALFQDQFKSQNAIEHFKLSLKLFSESRDYFYYKSCLESVGMIYCTTNTDSANVYAQRCMELAQEKNDDFFRISGYTIMSALHFYNDEWQKSIEWSKKIVSESVDLLQDNEIYYYLCLSYIKIGNLDSAQNIMDIIPSPITTTDSLSYYQCLSNLAKAKHSYDNSIEYQKIPDKINTDIDRRLQDNTLVAIEKNIDSKHVEQNHERVIFRYFLLILSILLLVIVASVFMRCKHKRALRVYEKQLCETRDKTTQLIDQLERIVKEKDNALSQIQKDFDKTDSKSLEKRNKLIESIEGGLSCYSSVMTNLLKQMKASSGEKNSQLAAIMDEKFFAQLRMYLNLRYDNLIDKLTNGDFNLNKEEINIICLDLCQFPNTIIWYYSKCDRSHSVLTKKRIIARKVIETSDIKDIPRLIQNQSSF